MTKPTAFEQFTLELINQARLNPSGEFERWVTNATPEIQSALNNFDVDLKTLKKQFDALTPVAAVVWNEKLGTAALGHTRQMREFDQQSHQLPGELDLGDRLSAAGYNFSTGGENVFAFAKSATYSHAGFFIDWGNTPTGIQQPAGHRVNIMRADFTEVGIGHLTETNNATSVGPNLVTQDFGNRPGYTAQITGVVFNDTDGDRFYDMGEGVSDTSIASGAASIQNYDTGGYNLAVGAGTHKLVFNGTMGQAAITVVLGSANIKVDQVDPGFFRSSVSATLGAGALGLELLGEKSINATGNSSANTIYGNMARNTIDGGSGADKLYGRAGADTLIGGTGSDRLYGDSGGDRLYGKDGNDRLYGGSGNDALSGSYGGDDLVGGTGADTLTGGNDADSFIFTTHGESTRSSSGRDTIMDFTRSQGDKIDLSAIDANAELSGNQTFKFIGTASFSDTAGELRFKQNASDGFIFADLDGDGEYDFSIHIDDAIRFVGSDFLL